MPKGYLADSLPIYNIGYTVEANLDQLHGIELIRAYELSWLNANGKPQLGLLEIKQDFGKPAVDTWKLKAFLESINNKSFFDIKAVKLAIYDYIKIDNLQIIEQQNFGVVKYFEQLTTPSFNCKMSYGLRFICQQTKQPHIGTVNILTSNPACLNAVDVQNIVNSFRNSELVTQSLVIYLFNTLCLHANDGFILSVHLNRRGGVSYQALCSNKAMDVSPLCCRSVLE